MHSADDCGRAPEACSLHSALDDVQHLLRLREEQRLVALLLPVLQHLPHTTKPPPITALAIFSVCQLKTQFSVCKRPNSKMSR